MFSHISYYTLTDLSYNILKVDEQTNKSKITHSATTICIYICLCLCVCVYLCIYTYRDSMFVCMHIHVYISKIKIKTNNTWR